MADSAAFKRAMEEMQANPRHIFKDGFLGGHSADASRYSMANASRFDPATANMPVRNPPLNHIRMIASRMRWDEGANPPFKAIHAHALNEEHVVVFVIAGGRALIIHDDANLFPSDALVTQLRLLEKN